MQKIKKRVLFDKNSSYYYLTINFNQKIDMFGKYETVPKNENITEE